MSSFQQQPGSHPQMSEAHRPEPHHEDSIYKTVGKKYAGGVASKAGGQTEEYIEDHHEEIGHAAAEYDDVKARAQAGFDDAKTDLGKNLSMLCVEQGRKRMPFIASYKIQRALHA